MISWKIAYANKIVTAEEALSHIKKGQTIFVGSGAGEPRLLTDALANQATRFWDIELIHLTSAGASRLTDPNLGNNFRYNTFYIGRGLRDAVAAGTADYTPMNISELPGAMASGIVEIDIALIQVSVPDAFGLCSLGVSVDATKAAVENASLVVAQVNENMPVTIGDSMIPVENIDYLVEGKAQLIELPPFELDPISLTIGRHISSLIDDGMCLHFDRGPISAATMRYLDTKRDLGIHTDILTDDILRLLKSRSVSNRKKKINKGKTVATMVLGSRELYETVNANPFIEILPIDQVSDPFIIAQNDNMVVVQTIQEIEVTGLARAERRGVSDIRGLPASMDFINGASRSKGGFTILAMPSTTRDGQQSRIVAMSLGGGVAFVRSSVHFVVTEYGFVNLYGRSLRERAIALISIAHPKFRQQLLEEAKRLNYVDKDLMIPSEKGCIYPHHYEFYHTFKDDLRVFFRPAKPTDAKEMQRMFYRLSPNSVRMRYHGTIKTLSRSDAQRLAHVDYSQDMAIVGLVGPRYNQTIIAEARYMYNPSNNMGEFDIVIDEKYQGRGIGTFLANHLNKIAFSRNLNGVYAEVIAQNGATIALLNKAWPTAQIFFDGGSCAFIVRFPDEDVRKSKDSIVIYSGRFSDYSYGEEHPFHPDRARVALQLMKQQGYLDEPWIRVEEPRMVGKERLIESHNPKYIEALEEANSGEWKERFLEFHLGNEDCPVFPGLFDYVLLYTSATITAVDLITNDNANVVFNLLGGFHHASRSFAAGFCYVNDVLVAIDIFLSRGFRVAYVDIDAHHGNGVQDAYYGDDRVLVISLHQTGKNLYPWSGFETEIGEGIGRGFTVNIPLPDETDDEAFEMVFDRIVPSALEKFSPSVVIAVVGADMHKSDPMANLNLTNNGMVYAIKKIRDCSRHLLLLAAGGYDLQATTRAWARMWAAANRIDALPDYLLVIGGRFREEAGRQHGDIADMNYQVSGKKKEEIIHELNRIAEFHELKTLPRIGSSSINPDVLKHGVQ
ncbi:MAG: GNAT family N-acetyltransferase [Deltaproteobacteria bacterium]|nr:GNAT family N-acetyltransferase [Deltaproteobacteria bacterium]